MSDPSLAELGRIIRRIEEKTASRRGPSRRVSREDLLGGIAQETEQGTVLVVRHRFELAYRHGHQPLGEARELGPRSLALLTRMEGPVPDGRRLLYLDAETTGLAGGTGTYAFLVGVGFFDEEAFEVRQYFMRDLDEEPALLAALEEVFGRFDGIVTYNGSGFDVPLLETRFVLARRRFPVDGFHLDLLGPARRLWSARLADCRLGTLEQHVLRFTREDDLPGAVIPSVYFDYLRRKHPGHLSRIFDHNRHDVLSLAALAGWLGSAVARAPAPCFHPEELAGMGRLLEVFDEERGLACYRMALAQGLATPWRERTLLRLAVFEKRRSRWDEARALWEEVISAGRLFDPRPWAEIAKVHEHRRRDLAAASAVVEEALLRARRVGAPAPVQAAFEHRLRRLTRRLAAGVAERPFPGD